MELESNWALGMRNVPPIYDTDKKLGDIRRGG